MEEKSVAKPTISKVISLLAENERLQARVSQLETALADIVIHYTNNEKVKNDFITMLVENLSKLTTTPNNKKTIDK